MPAGKGKPRKKAATKKLPTTGAEANYTGPGMFPRRRGNCYSFAIDMATLNRKLQPGELAGNYSGVDLGRGCRDFVRKMRKDSKASKGRMYPSDPARKCRKGYYKVQGFVDPHADFHYYRQLGSVVYRTKPGETLRSVADKFKVRIGQVRRRGPGTVLVRNANVWAHKRGLAGGPVIEDSCGKPILDPRRACRDYGDLDYTKFCASWCVLKNGFKKRRQRSSA